MHPAGAGEARRPADGVALPARPDSLTCRRSLSSDFRGINAPHFFKSNRYGISVTASVTFFLCSPSFLSRNTMKEHKTLGFAGETIPVHRRCWRKLTESDICQHQLPESLLRESILWKMLIFKAHRFCSSTFDYKMLISVENFKYTSTLTSEGTLLEVTFLSNVDFCEALRIYVNINF